MAKERSCGVQNLTTLECSAPLWDPRNRRRSSSEQSTSSGFSSCSSPEGQTGIKSGSELSQSDHVQRRTMAGVAAFESGHRDTPAAHAQLSMLVTPPTGESRSRVKVFIRVQGESDETCLRQIYKPILDLIDPETDVIDFFDDVTLDGGKWPLLLFAGCTDASAPAHCDHRLATPSMAVVLLIRESEILGADRLEDVSGYFRRAPWKFHHSECVSAPRIQAYPYNSLDYFSVADQLPVCSVRQVHGSREHIRLQRYVSHDNWSDTYNLYQLIIGNEPDYRKPDFCVFTVETRGRYTIQFALKRLPKDVSVSTPCHTVINFQVSDACALVPLLPHRCQKLSENRWLTTDLDGNDIFLEEVSPGSATRRRHRQRHRSRTKGHPSKRSSSGGSTSSFASILLDTAREFLDADEISTSGSVFSEPYAFVAPKDFSFDGSSSASSMTHSVEACRAYRFRSRPASVNDVVGDVTDVRATPEHRRFAWVREMIDVGSERHPDVTCNNKNRKWSGSHQHTDSGFADDRSEESDRIHPCDGRCHGLLTSATDRKQSERMSNGACVEDVVDACDQEIERLQLYHSNPDVCRSSPACGYRSRAVVSPSTPRPASSMSDIVKTSLSKRTMGDVLPNKLSLNPASYRNGHQGAIDGEFGVQNIRATSGVPCRDLASPGFGRIPPRCTSTPLMQNGSQDKSDPEDPRRNRRATMSPQTMSPQTMSPQIMSAPRIQSQGRLRCERSYHGSGLEFRNSKSLVLDIKDPVSGSGRGQQNNSNSSLFDIDHLHGGDVSEKNVQNDITVIADVHREPTSTPPSSDIREISGMDSTGSEPARDPDRPSELSFEEAAIDCPPSFVRRAKQDSYVRSELLEDGATSAEKAPAAEATQRSTIQPRSSCVTSMPRSRSVSKMVTFAEEVQEKDISICLDDTSETSPESNERNDGESRTIGFWI